MEDTPESVSEAAEYRHDDGPTEIVFAVDDGRVLTVREYPDESTFEDAIAAATYVGQHEGVAELPDVEAFQDAE